MDLEKGVLRIRHGTWRAPTRVTGTPRYLQMMLLLPDGRQLVADFSKIEWKEFPKDGTFGAENTVGHFEISVEAHDEWDVGKTANEKAHFKDVFRWNDEEHLWEAR